MVSGNLSIFSSSSSSLLSLQNTEFSNSYSSSSSSSLSCCCSSSSNYFCSPNLKSLLPKPRHARRSVYFQNLVPRTSKIKSTSKHEEEKEEEEEEEENPQVFLENNSIADFMRFQRKDGVHGLSQLQTAIVTYKKKFPWSLLQPFLQVDLVSTIHIADKEYFATLQKELEWYDCVLYEMVASKETLENRRNPASMKLKSSRSRGFNILGFIQRQMARILKLDFQLDCLDYHGEKWYHADLDYETFKSLQLERGESFFTFARDMTLRSTKAMVQPASIPENLGPWRSKLLWASRFLPMPLVGLLIIGGVCAQPETQASEYPELEALSRLDFGAAMKVFLAKRLTSEFTQVTAAIEERSVIIGERNKVAMEALERAISDRHNRIAVLYGGGHMPDLGRRLREELNLVPTQVRWITAWSIRNRELKSRSLPFLKKLAEMSGWPLNRYQTLALLIFSSFLALDLWFWELFFGTVVNWTAWAASEVSHIVENARFL